MATAAGALDRYFHFRSSRPGGEYAAEMAIERVADTGPLQWILQAHGVPLVFERYCQVYYPYIERLTAAGDASPAAMRFRLVRWREIAELLGEERLKREEGVTYRPGFRMTYLPRPTPAYVGPM